MKRGRITLEFASIRPILCFSIALLLIGGTVSSPISLWIGYQQAFADTAKVTSVSSTNTNGAYKADDTIHVTVTFDKLVNVNINKGTPRIQLETGVTDRNAIYASGTGTKILTFDYVVQARDTSSDLDYKATTSLTLDRGIISEGSGNAEKNAVLTLPAPGAANSLGSNKDIVIDTTAPTTTITTKPSNPSTSTSATFSFSSSESGSTFQCDLDGGGFATCTSSKTYSGLSEASHTFSVKATDAAGNTGNAAPFTWTIDTTVPVVTVPADITKEATSASGAAVTYSASALDNIDGAKTPSCNPASGSTFGLGTTAVTCSATDAAGNSASKSFNVIVVDTTDPVVTLNGAAEIFVELGTSYTELGAIAQDLVNGMIGVTTTGSVDANALGPYTIKYSATDSHGNTGTASRTVTVRDTIAPDAPIISTQSGTTKNNVITITGTAEAGSTVQVFDGGTSLGTTTADADGNWLFTTGTLADATYTITATAKDASGNTSVHSSSIIITVDTHASDNPTIDSLGPTNNQTPTISGTAEAGSTVQVFDGGTSLGTTTADADGNWLFTTGTLSEGTHSITATATDVAGNTSGASASLSLVIDLTKPVITPPEGDITVEAAGPDGATVTYSPSASDNVGVSSLTCTPASGSIFELGPTEVTCTATDAAGNSASKSFNVIVVDTTDPVVTLNGAAEIFVELGTSYTELGAIAQDLVDLELEVTIGGDTVDPNTVGTYTIIYSATDNAGNEGSATRTVNVVDTTAPDMPIISTESGTTKNNVITITGTAEAGSTVEVFEFVNCEVVEGFEECGDTSLGTTTADADGNWLFTTGTLADATYTITATAKDASGNTSVHSSSIIITVDTTAPAAPHNIGISTPTASTDSQTITGLAEPGSTVTLLDSDGEIVGEPVIASQDGTFEISTGGLSVGENIFTLTATDQAGNTLDSTSVTIVVDQTPPTLSAPSTFVSVGIIHPLLDVETGQPVIDESGNEILVAQVTYDVHASDNVDLNILNKVVCTIPSHTILPLGTYTITCNVSDAAGNAAPQVSFTADILSTTSSEDHSLTIPSSGTITIVTAGATPAGVIWSLMQDSTITNIITFHSDTASTTFNQPIAGGTNVITLGFVGEILNIKPSPGTSPCNPTCTISITFTQADLEAQGLTLDQIRILHDANEDLVFDPTTESLRTTVTAIDGHNCVADGVVVGVCGPEDSPFTATATVGSFSKFAIGGVKSVLFLAGVAGGGGTLGPSVTQFSVSTAGAAGFAAILELDPNKPHTNIVDTFDPSTVTMRLAHPEGAQSVEHVGIYLNLGGIFREVTDSDTYIIWDKNQPLQVVDPHGFMKGVDLKPSIIGKNLQLKLSLTFVKEMPKSDVLVRAWDADLNTKNIRYKDAIQIVPPQTISPESKVPVFVKNNAAFWADGKITDSDFVQGIQYLIQQKIMIVPASTAPSTTPSVTGTTTPSVSGTTSPIISGTTTAPGIPAWVKNNAKWWSEDQITEKDFLSGIQWMIANGVITVSK